MFCSSAFSATDSSKALFKLWGKVNKPEAGEASSIGSYSAGCLAGAEKLPMDGPGFAVMRPSRVRYYGHPTLVAYIEKLAKDLKAEGFPLLLVGDMGRPRGGPMVSGHASHQIGLDVDLWYRMLKKAPSRKERENLSAEQLVQNNKVTKGFTKQVQELVRHAAEDPAVDRIFIHAAMKKELCNKFPSAPWLTKLRPWWGHADHLHVRLRCPEGSASCEKQEPVKEVACGPELDWWFTAEAREEGAKKAAAHPTREFPVLPAACGKLIADYLEVHP